MTTIVPGWLERAVRYLIIDRGSFVVTNHHRLGFMSLASGDSQSYSTSTLSPIPHSHTWVLAWGEGEGEYSTIRSSMSVGIATTTLPAIIAESIRKVNHLRAKLFQGHSFF